MLVSLSFLIQGRSGTHGGTGGAGAPRPVKKNKVKLLDQVTCYQFSPDDYTGQDGLLLRKEDWDEEKFRTESLNLIGAIFRCAHGEIWSQNPRISG